MPETTGVMTDKTKVIGILIGFATLFASIAGLLLTYDIRRTNERVALQDKLELMTNRLATLEANTQNIKESVARLELNTIPRK